MCVCVEEKKEKHGFLFRRTQVIRTYTGYDKDEDENHFWSNDDLNVHSGMSMDQPFKHEADMNFIRV